MRNIIILILNLAVVFVSLVLAAGLSIYLYNITHEDQKPVFEDYDVLHTDTIYKDADTLKYVDYVLRIDSHTVVNYKK